MNGEVMYPTPAEREALDVSLEEMGEAIQIIGKAGRHGLGSRFRTLDNRELLELEIGHVLAAVDVLVERGILDVGAIDNARRHKLANVQQWLHHPENVAAAAKALEARE
jgi:hypothetical protein